MAAKEARKLTNKKVHHVPNPCGPDDEVRVANVRSLTDDLRLIGRRAVLVAAAAARGTMPAKDALRSVQLDSYTAEYILDAINDEAVQ